MKNSGWQKTAIPFLGDTKLNRIDFDNGLRAFVLENKVAPVFSYQTWFNVGSRDEEEGKSGLAHLFEHMMFKGTKKNKPGIFDRSMESAGARDLNAFTSFDYTAYVASLPVESFELVASLESDRMVGLSLTKEQFESEREVVRNERKQVMENNPEGRIYEELQKLAYARHPYGRPIIGFEKDLDAMSTKDCEDFYRTHYAPNNAVICVAGNMKTEKVAQILQKFYGKIPAQKRKEISPALEPAQEAERVKILSVPVQVEKIFMAYKVPNAVHPDQVALGVLSYLLSTGRSSRLYKALVSAGLCIEQGSSVNGSKDSSLFYVSASCQKGKSSEEVIGVIDREINKIIDSGLEESELKRIKNKISLETFQGLSTNSSLCRFIGANQLVMGDIRLALEEMEKIKVIERAEVQAVARKYLNPKNRTVVVGKPA